MKIFEKYSFCKIFLKLFLSNVYIYIFIYIRYEYTFFPNKKKEYDIPLFAKNTREEFKNFTLAVVLLKI